MSLSNLKLVTINSKYCEYLRQFDYRVSYNSNEKESRPFVGILFKIHEVEYFAPLSSPKAKHLKMKNTLDFYKIDSGKLGAINFNNMIPVPTSEYIFINVNNNVSTKDEANYQELVKNQLRWLNDNKFNLRKRAQNLYERSRNNKLPKIVEKRCYDFRLLEEKCFLYQNRKNS